MINLLHEIPLSGCQFGQTRVALRNGRGELTYAEIVSEIERVAAGLQSLHVVPGERVMLSLPKSFEFVIGLFSAARIGAIAVPINPNLGPDSLRKIISDCQPGVLVTNMARLRHSHPLSAHQSGIRKVVLCDNVLPEESRTSRAAFYLWKDLNGDNPAVGIKADDVAAIVYTSGSTGTPKGVVLSHENLVLGAKSVAQYLGNSEHDRLLAALPLSFDAGLSQITIALLTGGMAVVSDHLFPRDLARAIEDHRITGLTAIPSIWHQLADLDWTGIDRNSLRYFANTGGKLHRRVLKRLRQIFPTAEPYLMYGLTEAFRSTYLPPSQIDLRPDSIGKAIPNVEILIVREDGTECTANETGEIVHVGPLVALGYWGGNENSYGRFAQAPPCSVLGGRAVWTGDLGYKDNNGFLYFAGRRDEMIKISGYRLSPLQVEEAALNTGHVAEAVAFAAPNERGETEVWLVAVPVETSGFDFERQADSTNELIRALVGRVSSHVIPKRVVWRSALPKDPNGKASRNTIKTTALQGARDFDT